MKVQWQYFQRFKKFISVKFRFKKLIAPAVKAKVYVTNILRSGYQMLKRPDNAGAWCA